ncbi:unnamed protein product [Oikopleura dioica]|uniref:Uncharacterized protein n=1 Tax=Oikopleura dioica TaxID=34765 RepID=E4Y876_OIKDI|nr:unnamed protein product [Oikopleura dioica]
MKENRTSTKLKQWQVREEIIKDCELNEEFAKELFTLEMNKKFSEVSKRFADKIEGNLECNCYNKQRKIDMSLIAYGKLKNKKRREEFGLDCENEIELEENKEQEEVVLEEIIVKKVHQEKQIFCSALLSL